MTSVSSSSSSAIGELRSSGSCAPTWGIEAWCVMAVLPCEPVTRACNSILAPAPPENRGHSPIFQRRARLVHVPHFPPSHLLRLRGQRPFLLGDLGHGGLGQQQHARDRDGVFER